MAQPLQMLFLHVTQNASSAFWENAHTAAGFKI
jgi:hypothetical protein